MEDAPTCQSKMAKCGPLESVAICSENCCVHAQHCSCSAGCQITTRDVHWCPRRLSNERQSRLRMPSLRIAEQSCRRQYHSQMVASTRLGLNLSASPNHAQNINLVLNLNTGLASPQFHCKYDAIFETTWHSKCDVMTSANWKQVAGFVKYDGLPITQDKLSSRDSFVVPNGTDS